jgi:hypothetical protein
MGSAGTYYGTIDAGALTDNRAYTLPNNSGTFALVSDIPTSDNYQYWVAEDGDGTTRNVTAQLNQKFSEGNGIDINFDGSNYMQFSLAPLTSEWDQTGAFDISLNNSASELKIRESNGTLFGIFDVGDLTSTDKTYTFPDASGTVVLDTATQTLTNKTLTDSTTTFQDDADNSRKLQLQLSGITAATTRTLTVPNTDGTIALGTGSTGYVSYWSDANTLTSEQYLNLSRGGTGSNLSGVAQGGIIYKGATGLDGTGALTGMLKGNGTSTPSAVTSTSGYVTYWSDNNTISGEAQLGVSRGGTGIGSYTQGDLLYATAGTTLSKLPIGTSGRLLSSNGTTPVWLDVSGWDQNSSNDITTFTALTDTPSAYAGTSGYLVRVNGTPNALEFFDASTWDQNASNDITTSSSWTGGDLSGTGLAPTVSRINGVTLGTTTATGGNILVGDGSQWVTRAVSGDVTINSTGVTTVGSDKILESMLKAVNTAADEDILTYETTTGDFEWHTPSELGLQTSLLFQNGLTNTGGTVRLGGNLTQNTTITLDNAETLTFTDSGTGDITFNLTGTGNFNVQDNGVSALYVKSDGNVGIGASDPTYKLDVAGDIRVRTGSDLYLTKGGNTIGIQSVGASQQQHQART